MNKDNYNTETRLREKEGELSKALGAERRERQLKNEAYAFLRSEGLTSQFLDFINDIHRTRSQDEAYRQTMMENLRGLWIGSGEKNLKDEQQEQRRKLRKHTNWGIV